MKVQYKLLGQPCNPVNRSEIYLEVNNDQESVINQPKPHVGINNLYFAREDILKIMNYLNSAPGITEGIPFDIEIMERGQTEVLNLYLDLMDGLKRSNDGISATVKMLQSLDWLDDKTDGFTFESMYNETGVTPFQIDGITYNSYQDYFDKRCIFVPYVISTIPNFRDAFMVLASAIQIGIEMNRSAKNLSQLIASCANPFEGTAIARLGVEIAFIVFLLAILIILVIQLVNCLVQPVKYHGAMLMIDMLKIASKKMGLKFQSSIWDNPPYNKIAYLPEKYNPIEDIPYTASIVGGISLLGFVKRGFTTPGYATNAPHDSTDPTIQKGYMNGTGGDLFRLAKKYCNGKIIIDQTNNLILERRDYFPSTSSYQLTGIRQDWNGYNTDELFANMIIRFADDLNDKNSIDRYIGTILQATHQQIITNNQALVGLKGLREISLYAARGIAKDKLLFTEENIYAMGYIFNAIANVFIATLNVAIATINGVLIPLVNTLFNVWNFLMVIMGSVVNAIADVYNIINSTLGGSNSVPPWTGMGALMIPPLTPITPIPYNPILNDFSDRINTLLVEDDMITTPKLLMIDNLSSPFVDPGGYSGQKRIAYLYTANLPFSNQSLINAQHLWDNFYYIDAFVGSPHNRFTKITPALNKDSEKNPITLSLADFKTLVSNPKINDNFGEQVIADSIQWYIERNGIANIDFRKSGWLSNPQSNNGAIRSQEININLQIKTSLPNGK